jgi:hypothetical protein
MNGGNNMTTVNVSARLLTEREAALILGFTPGTLRKLRCTGYIPGGLPDIPYLKLGRSVRYDMRAIEAYIDGLKEPVG